MKLELQHIAKVEMANIILDSISVIAGYNCTGKSTISRALYAALVTTKNLPEKVIEEKIRSIMFNIEKKMKREITFLMGIEKVIYNKLSDYWRMNDIKELSEQDFLEIFPSELSEKYSMDSKIMFHNINMAIEEVKRHSDKEYLSLIFNRELNKIFNQQIKSFNTEENGNIHLKDSNGDESIEFIIGEKLLDFNLGKEIGNNVIYINPIHLLEQQEDLFFYSLSNNGSEVKRMLQKEPSRVNDYVLEEVKELEEASSIVDNLIADVIKGKLVMVDNSLYCKDMGTDEPIRLANVASGMKNLLMIQRLIKNGSLRRGDILIIDEPEVNLHPKWQVAFAEILVLLNLKLGIRILLNSHSPYFIRAIECKMAQYETLSTARFYLMNEGNSYGYVSEDVTENIEKIYSDLSEPLEEL